MEDYKVSKILSDFNLEIYNIEDVRGVYRLETNRGIYCLKGVDFKKGRLNFILEALKHLENSGFCKFPKFIDNEYGEFIIEDEKKYILTEWIEGEECKLINIEEIEAAAKTIAQFHQSARNFIPIGEDVKIKSEIGRWPNNWRKICRQMVLIKDEILNKDEDSKDNFDKIFIKWVDYYLGQFERALVMLGDTKYRQLCHGATLDKTFCHHSLAGKNMIITSAKEVYLVDFDRIIFDLHLHDICNFMRRFLPGLGWSEKIGARVLEIYQEYQNLSKEELKILYVLLYTPYKFWHTARRYYIKGRKSPKLEDYLKETVATEYKKQKFLKWYRDKYL